MAGPSENAGIEYAGMAGISSTCIDAVRRFLQHGDEISAIRILTHEDSHCLLLTYGVDQHVAIKSGFSSGYSGEGPRTFAEVIFLLSHHGFELDEYEVSREMLERLDYSSLTNGDMQEIFSAKPVRPQRWHDYIYPYQGVLSKSLSGWSRFPLRMPFALIDHRIRDLALNFEAQPDASLLSGYRRLEDIVRKRTGLSDHGAKLFSQAFVGANALLGWTKPDGGDLSSRGGLFPATYMAYRNPRAHLESVHIPAESLGEFLLLNHLYLLEADAIERSTDGAAVRRDNS